MLFMNSPLEQFEINNFVNNLSFLKFTTFSLYCMLVLGVYYMFNMYVFKSGKLISTNYNMFIEALYSTMLNMVKSQMGNKGNKYFPLMYSLFMFMLFSNLISMIPYNFAINAQLMFTISLSLIKHKFEYFGLFMPSGTSLPLVPFLVMIEMISNIARSISLGLRLGANMLSGHLLLTILCGLMFDFIMSSSFIIAILGFIPLIMILGIVSLEFAMAAMQAYVFCVLTCSYIKDAIYLH
ncbi:F1F0 ATP synthase subunit A (mitochondrion) [Starmerella bacillaris]|uniref:ATP synthase subunit a n=1 Tax=Starmerella bacillaris TaxID=1247836 RepID=A0AAV5RRW7_STABA|nr:F1F0 ATP synthase subunit A [Starmerella bacillaris]